MPLDTWTPSLTHRFAFCSQATCPTPTGEKSYSPFRSWCCVGVQKGNQAVLSHGGQAQAGCTGVRKCHLVVAEASSSQHPTYSSAWQGPGDFSRGTYLEEIPFTCTLFLHFATEDANMFVLIKSWMTCGRFRFTTLLSPAPDLKGSSLEALGAAALWTPAAGESAASSVLETLSMSPDPVCTCVTALLLQPPACLGPLVLAGEGIRSGE